MAGPDPVAIRRTGDAAFRAAIIILITMFCLTLWQADRLRAHWWAFKLASSDDLQERGRYLAQIAGVGERSRGAIVRLAADSRAEVRALAVYALQALPDGGIVELTGLLADSEESVRDAAATAMSLSGKPEAARVLCDVLAAPSEGPARAAAAGLCRIDTADARAALCTAARRHPSPVVRAQSIESLVDLLQTESPTASAAAESGDVCDAVEVLVMSLGDEGRFTGMLSIESQRVAAEEFVTRGLPPPSSSTSAPVERKGHDSANAMRKPRRVATPTNDVRCVGEYAASCLSLLTGQEIDWHREARAGLADRCRMFIRGRRTSN